MSWTIESSKLNQSDLLTNESLFFLGNGYLGVRGNFEEGYSEGDKSIRGTYINAFHDKVDIEYGEKLHGFPDTQEKLLNIMDAQSVQVWLDDERFSLFEGEVLDFQRKLRMDQGYSERIVHWRSPKGKEVNITFKRLVSFVNREVFVQEITVDPVKGVERIAIHSELEGDVSNFVDPDDPRVASGHAKRLAAGAVYETDGCHVAGAETHETKMSVCCSSKTFSDKENHDYESNIEGAKAQETYTFSGEEKITFTKRNVYMDSMRYGQNLEKKAVQLQGELADDRFEDFLEEQARYLNDFWKTSDILIDGDDDLQQGIRFNMYHLLQSVGKDPKSNIAAKGLSGEGYEGHYFWDTEIYMFPFFLMTNPEIAKNLLLHRHSLLDSARQRAKDIGHTRGALFPWRTITGGESSAFFPAGTAQYHINGDIAYSYIQYYMVSGDEDFFRNEMAEVLFETSRLWLEVGHFHNGQFRIDSVTGPDEYTCIVNNNYYTNVMAKNNLLWAGKIYDHLKKEDPERLTELMNDLEAEEEEIEMWKEAAEKMFLPYNEELKINEQDDTFLQKGKWDLDTTPKDKYPLLLNYHPLLLYRYQVCKQADTVLAHFLLEDFTDQDTIEHSYNYYEAVTTHDSSLSFCVFSIMASKLGQKEKAYDYFSKTSRLDIDNLHGNTKDGLHMANMGGTWMGIVYGFAGLRVKESNVHFSPYLPEQWGSLEFNIRYRNCLINLKLTEGKVVYTLVEGDAVRIFHMDSEISLDPGVPVEKRTSL
ncbi:glycoside hydrolase family 65 protein [Salimicrobium halophilum]|uniref:Alpha,alpha-trehalose phosphorylase n=1 Tax=Salimicrobium halophilum TaxID=86666 RepID=A0A1G8UVM1_9BACI|nr:glycosyl hydrolase family 65 protein [Salimicrobium halophilum]SDJ57694.1 alpha,alpha-trehalose phosphorylase [Salimicrobium halophilum]